MNAMRHDAMKADLPTLYNFVGEGKYEWHWFGPLNPRRADLMTQKISYIIGPPEIVSVKNEIFKREKAGETCTFTPRCLTVIEDFGTKHVQGRGKQHELYVAYSSNHHHREASVVFEERLWPSILEMDFLKQDAAASKKRGKQVWMSKLGTVKAIPMPDIPSHMYVQVDRKVFLTTTKIYLAMDKQYFNLLYTRDVKPARPHNPLKALKSIVSRAKPAA